MKSLIRRFERAFLTKDRLNKKLLKEARELKDQAIDLSLRSSNYLEKAKATEMNWKDKWYKNLN